MSSSFEPFEGASLREMMESVTDAEFAKLESAADQQDMSVRDFMANDFELYAGVLRYCSACMRGTISPEGLREAPAGILALVTSAAGGFFVRQFLNAHRRHQEDFRDD